jgi:tetratricopeptide (TPR) repeat protein
MFYLAIKNNVRLSSLILVFAVLNIYTPTNAQENLPDLVQRVKPSVVKIQTYNSRGDEVAIGSGFCIAPGVIVTNYHVIEGATKIGITYSNKVLHLTPKILAHHKEQDLAILEIRLPPSELLPLSLATILPKEGERIFVVSNPKGLQGSISDGIISAIRPLRNGHTLIQMTAAISPGSSGGPVINMSGQVVGIVVGYKEGQNLNFMIPAIAVAKLGFVPSSDQSWIYNNRSSQTLESSYPPYIPSFPKPTIKGKSLPEARRLFNEGKRINNISLDHLKKNIRKEAEKSQLQSALLHFEAAVNIDPQFREAWLEIGDVCTSMYWNEMPHHVLNNLLRHVNEGQPLDPTIFDYNPLLQNRIIRAFEIARKIDPNKGDAYIGLAKYFRLGKTDRGYRLCLDFIRQWPQKHDGYECAGEALILTQEQKAAQYFRQAVRLNPQSNELLERMAESLRFAGQYTEANIAYREYVRRNPKDKEVLQGFIESLTASGGFAEAFQITNKLIKDKPIQGYLSQANINMQLGKHSESIYTYKKAISMEPDNHELHIGIARAYTKAQRYNEAIEAYKMAERFGSLDEHYIDLGDTLTEIGRINEAIDTYNKSIQVGMNVREAYAGLGSIHWNMQRYNEALNYYNKALEGLIPGSKGEQRFAWVRRNIGEIFLQTGNRALALEEYMRLKTLDKELALELFNLIYK